MGADAGLDVGVDIKLSEADVVKSILKSAEKNKSQIIAVKVVQKELQLSSSGARLENLLGQPIYL